MTLHWAPSPRPPQLTWLMVLWRLHPCLLLLVLAVQPAHLLLLQLQMLLLLALLLLVIQGPLLVLAG